ncbi:TPA: hypothetical protein M4155_004623 [Klebsiella pneumoniae]|nr:hypothetical protein [Klebsiella pneumoniae]
MTDITRLINSIKRRTSSARELGYDVLFVALDDLDVLADSLETALRANAAQAAHIEQLQDKFNKLAAENVALKESRNNLAEFIHEELDADYPLNMNLETPATERIVAGIKADGVEEWVSSRGGRWNGTTEEALKFAKQLREGGKV